MVVVVVVVVDFDGDGNVEVDATVDESTKQHRFGANRVHGWHFKPGTWVAPAKVITDAQYARGGQLLEGVVAMLTKMV